ncbi:chromate transporter [Paenibacillus alkalitolerans]|uniref:chromate transporter n=1 Tax=Paenibacillus alkalitolerans TaxID=2799335 RepID=UPI0018F5C36C|nr:chromate transporter [Paenibacillus alkalitolerans]
MNGTIAKRWRKLPSIFLTFCKIGPITFGGGYAMIPLIEKEVVDRRRWLKTEDVSDVFAVAQSIPGAVAINSATFIGYRLAGIPGAVTAMCGVLLPTFLIVLMLSAAFLQFRDLPLVEAAFEGIRAAIVAVICYAGYRIGKTAVLDKTTLGVVVGTVLLLLFVNVHPVIVILSGFFLGIAAVAVRSWLGLQTKLEDRPKEEEWGYMMGDGI